MQITFKYELKQEVITPLGTDGFIDTCAFDRGGNTYFVKTAHGGQWFNEEDLVLSVDK